jgi:hypothetical protein
MKFQKSTLATICMWIHAFFLLYGIYPLLVGTAQLQGFEAAGFCLIGLLLFVPILLSWWLLRKLHRLWLYLPLGVLISALCGALAWLFTEHFSYNHLWVGVATGIASLVLFISHAVARIRLGSLKKEFIAAHGSEVPFEMNVWEVPTLFTNPHPVHLAWFAVQYLVGLILRVPFYWHFVFYLTFADLFVLFGFRYLTRLDAFIIKNRKTASLPVRTMGKIHHILFVIGLLLILLFALPALFYGREPLADVSLAESQSKELSDTDAILPDSAPMNYDMTLPDIIMESGEQFIPPIWLKNAVKTILFLILAIALIGLIYAIYLAIRRAGENFAVENEDEVIFLDSKEDSRRSIRKKSGSRESRLSPNMQIRRRYKRTIRKSTKGRPTFWASPLELESQAGLAESADMQRLHGYYEKARYSKEGCTREDVAAMQKT